MYKRKALKPASYDRLETTIRVQIIPAIGNIQLGNIRAHDCQSLINDRTDHNASFSVVKKAYDTLSDCFKHAVIIRDIPFDPTLTVIGPSASTFGNKDVRSLTEDEEVALLEELDQKWVSSGLPVYIYKDAFIILVNTGLRQGELLALDWDDVDLVGRGIHVRKNALFAKGRNTRLEQQSKNSRGHQQDERMPSWERPRAPAQAI